MCKETKEIWVYGHVTNDLSTEYWDRGGWIWHKVPVDSCIASLVQYLNMCGVYTLACCCGHGENRPEIAIIEEVVAKAQELGYNVDVGNDGWPYTIRGVKDGCVCQVPLPPVAPMEWGGESVSQA